MKKISIVMCIDVEPDERQIAARTQEGWSGFEQTSEFFAQLRPQLEAATGSPTHLSWFLRMDPQIAQSYGSPSWVVTRYPHIFEQLRAAGDELGVHTHSWRWDQVSGKWIADFLDQEWIDHCVQMSFNAYQESLQQPCLSFRFGDRWMNNATLDLVEKLGARFDLTVEPGQKEVFLSTPDDPAVGLIPDYTAAPHYPYRPATSDFRKQGWWRKRKLWMIPLSSGNVEGSEQLRFWNVKQVARRLGFYGKKESIPLNLCVDASVLCPIIDSLLHARQTYLALVMRTDYCSNPDRRINVERVFNHLLSHPLVNQFVFETPTEAIESVGNSRHRTVATAGSGNLLRLLSNSVK